MIIINIEHNLKIFYCNCNNPIFFSELGDKSGKKRKRKKPTMHFTEGWVEFESKRVAKHVATTLNNTMISTKRKSKFCDIMWNIKYLSG